MNTVSTSMSRPAEGRVARAIEEQTTKIPSDVFLWAAGAAIVGASLLQLAFQRARPMRFMGTGRLGPLSLFVGQWAPTILLLGVYDKIVKVAGSDRITGGVR